MKSSSLHCLAGVLTTAFAAVLSSTASAADIIAGWDLGQQDRAPWYLTDNQTTTNLTASPGTSFIAGIISTGWTQNRNLNLFTGFTTTPAAGYALTLTGLTSDPIGNIPNFSWGCRVNEGSGYSAWTFSPDMSMTTAGGHYQTWDFADFTTTGTVQFGFFAYGGSDGLAAPGSQAGAYEIELAGVAAPAAAVPEASSLMLLAAPLLGAVLFRRQRPVRA